MLEGQLSYNIWLTLPAEIRHKLVTLFDIPRSGRTVVEYRASGAVVTSDGFTAPDLQAISLTRMQGLLHSDSDNFYKLLEEAITNIDALLGGTFTPPAPIQEDAAPEQRVDSSHVSSGWVGKPAFCDSCDSKGGRHKKGCVKNK